MRESYFKIGQKKDNYNGPLYYMEDYEDVGEKIFKDPKYLTNDECVRRDQVFSAALKIIANNNLQEFEQFLIASGFEVTSSTVAYLVDCTLQKAQEYYKSCGTTASEDEIIAKIKLEMANFVTPIINDKQDDFER